MAYNVIGTYVPGDVARAEALTAEFAAIEAELTSVNSALTGLGDPLQTTGGTMTGKLTLLTGAKSLESLESALGNTLGLINENDHGLIGVVGGAASPSAADMMPMVNMQRQVKPNGISVTGTSYLFHTKRHGSATASDGDLPALYNVVGYVESIATSTSLGGKHDIVGVAGIAEARTSSTARAYGLFGDARLRTTTGEAVACELDVRNISGQDAPTIIGDGSTLGLAVVGRVSGGGNYNTYGLLFQAASGASFRTGISFDPNSVLTHAIDISRVTTGISFAIVMPNNAYLSGLNAAGDTKLRLVGLSGTDNTLLMNDANILFTNNAAGVTYARITSDKNFGLGMSSFGSGTGGIIAIANATAVPSINPSGGGFAYVESGALKFRGSAGTITTLAPA